MGGGDLQLIRDPAEWRGALEAVQAHDFYHTYDYHQIAFGYPGATPHLCFYRAGDLRVAVPLLLRKGSLNGIDYLDATSVYGYAGPVGNCERLEPSQQAGFAMALTEALRSLGVVSLFSRLHPLLGPEGATENLGEVVESGETVVIDLRRPEAEQWRAYRGNRRREVTSLRNSEVVCLRSSEDRDFAAFLSIYAATMLRKSAPDSYLLDESGLDQLRRAEDFETELFVCKLGSVVVSAGLFVRCRGIVQYHLSGTREDYYSLAPTKLLLDTVRRWATESGCHTFHLGGGVGGRRDSLFAFKRGFSRDLRRFRLWKWVLDPEGYDQLVEASRGCSGESRFFPAYRAP